MRTVIHSVDVLGVQQEASNDEPGDMLDGLVTFSLVTIWSRHIA